MTAHLTLCDIATLTGWSHRHIRRQKRALGGINQGRRAAFPLHKLPVDLQTKWLEKQKHNGNTLAVVPAEPALPQLSLPLAPPAGANGSAASHELAQERYEIIAPLVAPDPHRAIWEHAGGKAAAVAAFLARQHQVGERTIWRWAARFRRNGLEGLAERIRADRGLPKALDQAGLSFLYAALLVDGAERRSVREIYRAYEEERAWRARHPEAGPPLPDASYHTMVRWWNQIPRMVRTMALEGVDAFSAHEEILSWRDLGALAPLEWVVMDHRMLDIHCLAPAPRGGWRLIRPWVTAALDMRTRRWLAWAVVEQPSSDSIASVLKSVCLRHGIPAHGYWDNGKDFRARWLEGRREMHGQRFRVQSLTTAMTGVVERLGMRITHAIPKRARSKIIEPNFLRLAHYDATLPWYCGHKPEHRPEAFDALVEQHARWLKEEVEHTPFLPIEQIAAQYDDAFATLNETPLEGQGMEKPTPRGRGWMSPDECWREHIGEALVRKPDPHEIQYAFLKRRRIAVDHGEVQVTFAGRKFHYRLPEPLALMTLNGQEVELAYDPLDLGTAALYHRNQLVGLVHNIELRKMGEQDFVADERNRRAARRYVTEFLERLGKAGAKFPSQPERARRRAEVRGWPALPSPCDPAPIQLSESRAAGGVAPAGSQGDDARLDFYGERK